MNLQTAPRDGREGVGRSRENIKASRSRAPLMRSAAGALLVATFALAVHAQEAATPRTTITHHHPAAEGVPRAECFPFERLPAAERAKAEELLLKALDSEALYTIVGAIKPVSSGFGLMRFKLREIDLARLEERRRILAHWRCGVDLAAHFHHFARAFDGERSFDSVIVNLPLLREMLAGRQTFFRRWGITPNADVTEVLMTIEYDATSARNVGYGYLFGYPEHAVNFFGEAVDAEERTGVFVERDFISIPTFEGGRRFVYAVPRGYREQEVDHRLRERTAPILAAYRERRARYVGGGRAGVVELLRDWFCNKQGMCSPRNARFAAAAPTDSRAATPPAFPRAAASPEVGGARPASAAAPAGAERGGSQ